MSVKIKFNAESILNENSRAIILFFTCFVSCWVCITLQKIFDAPAVLASALVGLAGSFIPSSKFYDFKQLRAMVYTSSFVAMSSIIELKSLLTIVLISMTTTAVFVVTKGVFQGIGGKMGATAFLSVLMFSIFWSVL